MNRFFFFGWVLVLVLYSCGNDQGDLPVLGEAMMVDGKPVYPRIADFDFINQDGHQITNTNFRDKVYVANFIFLSCPTICPVMSRELKKVYDAYQTDDRVSFISHTIDPERDTIPRLKAYAETLGVWAPKWNFVTGNQDSIMNLAEESYYSAANADTTAPGGFVHSGGLLLIDKNRNIRGVYNSLESKETDRLIADIKRLLRE